MPAQIIPQTCNGTTVYALISDGVLIQVFDYLGAAALYAVMEGYEVTL